MKTTVKLLCIILVLCTLLSLTACGIAFGTYKLDSASMGGLTVSPGEMGMDTDEYYLEMTPFGTATFVFQGKEQEMKYGNGKIWPVDEEDEAVNMEIDGNAITLEMDGLEMVFKK